MSWATLADQVLKTSIGAFKTAGTYIRAAAPGFPVSISGVWDKNQQVVDPETGAPVDTLQPTFGVRLADLPAAPEAGDKITVAAVTYQVLAVEEDGQGGARLVLGRRAG